MYERILEGFTGKREFNTHEDFLKAYEYAKSRPNQDEEFLREFNDFISNCYVPKEFNNEDEFIKAWDSVYAKKYNNTDEIDDYEITLGVYGEDDPYCSNVEIEKYLKNHPEMVGN